MSWLGRLFGSQDRKERKVAIKISNQTISSSNASVSMQGGKLVVSIRKGGAVSGTIVKDNVPFEFEIKAEG